MTLQDLITQKPSSLSIRQKLILHRSLIKFTDESIIEFATKYPKMYNDIKDLIPEKFRSPEVMLMNKVMCYVI